jgi:hypothetical protein
LVADDRIGEVWRLRHGDLLLGEITITSARDDWMSGVFSGRPAFAEFEPLLTDEHDLFQIVASEFSDETYAAFKAHHERVIATMTLVSPSGPVVDYSLEVIGGDFATFRTGNEPFYD